MIPPLDHSVSIKSLIIPFTDGVKEKKYTVSKLYYFFVSEMMDEKPLLNT